MSNSETKNISILLQNKKGQDFDPPCENVTLAPKTKTFGPLTADLSVMGQFVL